MLGKLGDDVPGVEEAGQEAQRAEEDVDEGVGGAEAAFYPDCEGGGRGGLVGCFLGERVAML